MLNVEIAAVFETVADLLEFQGANSFRIRAYRSGARAIGDLTKSVESIIEDGNIRLTDIDGIGKDLAQKVTTLVRTGSLPLLDELLDEIPASVLAILRVPGLGPKKAAVLFNELGASSLDELRSLCEDHRVRELKGFGPKTEEMILKGLDIAAQADERIYWATAEPIVETILEYLKKCRGVKQAEVAGSYRRGKETVGNLDLIVEAENAETVMDHWAAYKPVEEVTLRDDTKMTVELDSGLQVDLRVVEGESFGAALQYFTGSKEHNVVLQAMAKNVGLKLNEYGLFRDDKQIAGRTEEEVYKALELPLFPPEIREARQEFGWAKKGHLPKLIELGDICGDLHSHTEWSDGHNSLEDMVTAAKGKGLKYLAVTDHSKRAAIANGMKADKLRKQWETIDAINANFDEFKVLKGIEVDILEQGGLDLDDDVLAEADWVVASVHFGQKQSGEQITKRIVDALKNPCVSALAHPTGRMINQREPYQVDLEAVFEVAVENGKMMELNANPSRLDLDDVACAIAKRHGVLIAISTDAHSIERLDAMRFGVQQARRGGLTKDDVGNTRPWHVLKELIGKPHYDLK